MRTPKIKSTIIVIIGIILLMLFATLWFSVDTISDIRSNLESQVKTRTKIISLKDNLTYMLDAEAGERGFVIAGDKKYLKSYEQALENISSGILKLQELNAGDPEQLSNLDTLQQCINRQLERFARIIELKKQGDEDIIENYLRKSEGQILAENTRRINNKMQDIEHGIFSSRQASTANSIAEAKIVFIVEAIFSLIVTLFLAMIIISELNRRAKAEKILYDTNAELKSKNKEIEQFAYVASHDLQEPLRSVSNFSSLLAPKLADHPDPKVRQYLETIMGGTRRMSALIYDLLEYSRIGKDTVLAQIDCNKLVNEVLIDMNASIRESSAAISVGKLPVVSGYSYLKSLFQNLLSNAIKFHAADQQPEVRVSARDQGSEYLFEVKDNGIGIEKEFHERIFLMFQRLHTRTEFAGTGIGLAQCRKIVELHGGKIWVESEQGKGTSFYFTIPK